MDETEAHHKEKHKAQKPLASQRFVVQGMTCNHCSKTVQQELLQFPETKDVQINILTGEVSLKVSSHLDLRAVARSMEKIGYALELPLQKKHPGAVEQKKSQRELMLFFWSLAWTLPVLVVHYGGFTKTTSWAPWVALFCVSVLQPTSAITYYRGALKSIRRRSLDMDVLVSISVATGFSYAFLMTLFPQTFPGLHGKGSAMEFFEAASLLICFIRLGKYAEARSRAKAVQAMGNLLEVLPQKARKLLPDGKTQEILLEEVVHSDRLVVLPGEKIPVDGVILEGESELSEAVLTGESRLLTKKAGDKVIAAASNHGGRLVIQAEAVGKETSFAKMIDFVQSAQAKKADIQRIADRLSAYFVPIVITIAFASGIYWGVFSSAPTSRALLHAIGVLVIACPCALGIAVPAAVMIGSSEALKRGILIKGGAAIESMGKINRLVFDKTGTLTYGKPELEELLLASGYDRQNVLTTLARVVHQSSHPLSQAALRFLEKHTISTQNASGHYSERPGKGVILESNDSLIAFGNEALMLEEGADPHEFAERLQPHIQAGASVSYLLKDNQILGAFIFKDMLRSEAKRVIEFFKNRGVKISLLSGDRPEAVLKVAQELGIVDFLSKASPQDKVDALQRWQNHGEFVCMVGDGINDASALAQANLSIALASAAGITQESGDIVLTSNGIQKLIPLFKLSKKCLRGIYQNLFVSLIYNVIAIPLAAGIGVLFWESLILAPSYAALAMVLSDFSVAANSLRLGTQLRKIEP